MGIWAGSGLSRGVALAVALVLRPHSELAEALLNGLEVLLTVRGFEGSGADSRQVPQSLVGQFPRIDEQAWSFPGLHGGMSRCRRWRSRSASGASERCFHFW